jgi:hypothetical protein
MVSTGRHHGFESLAEQRVLLALDFAGNLVEVLAQPFELRFAALRAAWRSGAATGPNWRSDITVPRRMTSLSRSTASCNAWDRAARPN